MMKRLFRDGVFAGYLNELEVVEHTPSADMYADVKTGGGWVQGHTYENPALNAMAIEAAHATLDRTDRIVLRRTYDSPNSEIALAVLKGVDAAAGTSTPTALTQNSTTWEISLATVLVAAAVTAIYTADITDERRSAYCGVAAATLGDFAIDTSGNLDASSNRIVNLTDPKADQDAATKNYVKTQVFPDQSGNSGKVLGTNGTIVSWGACIAAATPIAGNVKCVKMFTAAETSLVTTTYTLVPDSNAMILIGGTYTIYFELREVYNDDAYIAYARIYKNGVATGTERSNNTNTLAGYSEDLTLIPGDEIAIYAKNKEATYTTYIKNFIIYSDKAYPIGGVPS